MVTQPPLEETPSHSTLSQLASTYPGVFRRVPGTQGWTFQAYWNGTWGTLYEGNDTGVWTVDNDADLILEQVMGTVTE